MSNWSQLPHDLLIEIAQHINKIEDFFAFGVVCKTWAKAGKKEYFKGLWLWKGIPYLLLPSTDNDVREFYSLVDDDIVASLSIPKFKNRQCHESLGWLLAVEEDGSMFLLNPFSSVEIPVPGQSTFPKHMHGVHAMNFVVKFVLSASPSETSDFIVMIICDVPIVLAFWRPGDESWNLIRNRRQKGYVDVMYHGGHFYAIDYGGNVSVFTIHQDNPNPPECRIISTDLLFSGYNYGYDNVYILKTSLSLFIITRKKPYWNGENGERMCYKTRKFQVYEVDMSTGTSVEIYDIGSMVIFVGHNATFAIDIKALRLSRKIQGNRIYFSDDGWLARRISKNMGLFNLKTGTFELFYGGEVIPTYICHSIWFTPGF